MGTKPKLLYRQPTIKSMKTNFLLLLLPLFTCGFCYAQSSLAEMDSLGEYYFSDGQLDSSMFYHRRALKLAQKTGDPTAELNAYNWLFVLHFYREEEDSMARLLERMEPLAQSLAPTEASYDILSSFWNYKSFHHFGRGELVERIDADRKSLLLFEKQTSYDTSELAILYQNLGVALEEVGDYTQANSYSKKALELLRPSPLRKNLALDSLQIIYSMGFQLSRLLEFEQADRYFMMGRSLAQRLSQSDFSASRAAAALFYTQWGGNYVKWEKYRDADPLFDRALAILKRSDTTSDIQLLLRRNMIRSHLARGQNNEAERLIDQTIGIMQRDFPDHHYQLALTLELQAENYVAQENYATALPIYQRALQLFCPAFKVQKTSANPEPESITFAKQDILRVLRKKGVALEGDGQAVAAMASYQTAIQLFQQIRQDYITEAARLLLSEQNIPLFERAAGLALDLQQPELAFQLIERSKALSLQEALRDEAAFALGGIPEALREKAYQLQVQITYWEKEAYNSESAQDSTALAVAQDKLFAAKRESERLQDQIRREYPQFFDFKYRPENIAVRDVREQLLTPGTALLEYFAGENSIFLFGITDEQLLVETFSKGDDPAVRIRQFARMLQLATNVDAAQYAKEAYAIFSEYLDPVLSGFSAPVEHLYLIPDGPFTYIPFEALLTQPATQNAFSTLPYLVRNYTCSYGYSSALLLGSRNASRDYGEGFVGFAPSFGGSSVIAQRGKLSPLKYNIEAVNTLQKITGGISYTDSEASKAHLLAPSIHPLVLHLSTHATMDDAHPMGSKIYLANGEDISTQEIYNLPYSCGMVVLSACETGTGKYYKGEGMMSLARAFLQSGSPSVVTSLWKVDDRSTSELMVKFYTHLQTGLPKDQALRRAQLEFMAGKESEQLHHPYYWAAFIHIGDTAAISFAGGWPIWYWLGIALLIGGLAFFVWQRRS
jgi:CHAT domain-containing protein